MNQSELEKDLNSPEAVKERIEKNMLLSIIHEIELLKGYTRLQIFVTHGFLELLMHTLIKNKTKNSKKILTDSRSFPYSSQILILHEIGVLSDNNYKIYDWFRKIRNRAAHEPLFKLTEEHLKLLPEKYHDVNNFNTLCVDLALQLWNDNVEILAPVFVPTLTTPNPDCADL